jgi:ribonuclease HI
VYAAELQGILLALEMAQDDRQQGYARSKVCIFTDNQAAIKSSAKPKGKLGAYILKAIARKMKNFNKKDYP